MENEITTGEITALTQAVGAFLKPLAEHQATVQQRAIEADLEKFRLSSAERAQAGKRGFIFTLATLLIVGAVIAGFMVLGQYQFAYNALAFAAGAAGGYGIGRVRQQS